jgi:HPt (histidine-containing phosphotransfer) domain-containing protein
VTFGRLPAAVSGKEAPLDACSPAPVSAAFREHPELTVRQRFAELAGPHPEENSELLAILIDSFVGRAPQALAELTAAARRGAALDTAKAAHTLRGEAGNLGGTRLGAVLADLEHRGRSGELGPVDGDLERISAELGALCRALRAAGAEWS